MKVALYYDPQLDLKKINPQNVELVFSPLELSRLGKLNLEELDKGVLEAKRYGIDCHLEWDILMEAPRFRQACSLIEKINIDAFMGIRVQDPGAVEWLFEKTNSLIHLILETAHHNENSVQTWLSMFGKRIKRVIFSLEVPYSTLRNWDLPCDLEKEVLGVGKVLLFYTPRKLISPLREDEDLSEVIEAVANSEESPHRGFSLLENAHGTFMFHPRLHYVLDSIDEKEDWLTHLRIDNRIFKDDSWLNLFLDKFPNLVSESSCLKEAFPFDHFKGFFKANKSDVLFKRLKNYRLLKSDDRYVGEVIDVLKDSHVGIVVKRPTSLNVGDKISLHTPEGKIKETTLSQMRTSLGEAISSASENEIFFIPAISGISVKSQVLFGSSK